MKKRKIIFVAHHMTIGGVQKSLISALNAIDYEKYDITLYLRKNRTDLLPYVNKNVHIIVNEDKNHYYRKPKSLFYQIKIILLKLLGKELKQKKETQKLVSYIRKKQMEYEHAAYFTEKAYDIAISYIQGYTTEFVGKYIDAHTKIAFYQGSLDECHDVHEEVFPYFDSIVVEHDDVKKLLLNWYKGFLTDNKIKIIENYTDKDLLMKQGKEITIDRLDDKLLLCTCARMAAEKGFDLAVEAANILKNKGYKFQWYFVGDGPERGLIERKIKEYNLQNEIVLKGMQKNPYPYMMNCDIYVQPSKAEALSIAMLESRLLERVMVTTKTVGGCSIVTDEKDGILTEINAESLAFGIERLIINPELRGKIHDELQKIDYLSEQKRYREDWRVLLEG